MHPVVAIARDAQAEAERMQRLAALRAMEREYVKVRHMNPREANTWLDNKQQQAARRVQGHWRGIRVRRTLGVISSALEAKQRERAALAIQAQARTRLRHRRQAGRLREQRDDTRAGLVLELPLIQKRILDECESYRLVDARTVADVVSDAARALSDWGEVRQRSNICAVQRQRKRAETAELCARLRAVRTLDDCAALADIEHLRGAKRGAVAPEHVRLHESLMRAAQLEAEAAEKAAAAATGASSGGHSSAAAAI